MQGTIRIVVYEKQFKVYFSYNSDLVDIMREMGGWWHPKEKCWSFPNYKLQTVREELVQKLYKVSVTRREQS